MNRTRKNKYDIIIIATGAKMFLWLFNFSLKSCLLFSNSLKGAGLYLLIGPALLNFTIMRGVATTRKTLTCLTI